MDKKEACKLASATEEGLVQEWPPRIWILMESHVSRYVHWKRYQTWICSISSGANSFCPSTPQNSFRSAPVLPSMSRSVKKSHSCSTPKIRCFNCVNNGYGSKKFMINLISIICLYLKFHHVVSFWLFSKKYSKLWPECMAIATMTGSCPGVEQSSIQGGKLPSSSRSIKSGAMHLAPAPDIKELSNFLLLERSSIQVCFHLYAN